MNTLDTALHWVEKGISVLPIQYRSKRPNFYALTATSDIDGAGKPTWNRMKDSLPSQSDLRTWFRTLSNIAVVCGHNDLLVLDFDNMPAHELWMQTYGINGYADTFTVKTGRGMHYYYFAETMPDHTLKWAGGEARASGYCLTSPSTHPSGKKYTALYAQQEIMHIESINDVLPESVFSTEYTRPSVSPPRQFNPWQPQPENANGRCQAINESVSILGLLPDARSSGDGWMVAKCPLHDDKNASAWIDVQRNRFGCHKCVNGSLSIIDLYMEIHAVGLDYAINALSGMM